MPDLSPYSFVRAITLVLATFWTIRGTLRTIGFARNWERRLYAWGLSRRWLRRQIAKIALRATVLDPINLTLGFLLLALWVGPSRGWFRLDEWRGIWSVAPELESEAPTEVDVEAEEPAAEPTDAR